MRERLGEGGGGLRSCHWGAVIQKEMVIRLFKL